MCIGASFALFSRVKKHSEEKSIFYIKSTRLRFVVSEVVIAAIVWFINAIVWFINAPCSVQCDKQTESRLLLKQTI